MLSEAQRDVLRRLAKGASLVRGTMRGRPYIYLLEDEGKARLVPPIVVDDLRSVGCLRLVDIPPDEAMHCVITDAGRAALEVQGE